MPSAPDTKSRPMTIAQMAAFIERSVRSDEDVELIEIANFLATLAANAPSDAIRTIQQHEKMRQRATEQQNDHQTS